MAAPSKVQNLSSNNFMIMVAVITLLVVGVSALASKSLYDAIRRDMKVVREKSKADKQLKENLEAAPKLVEEYRNLGTKALLLESALPNTSDFPSLIVMLENMADTSGIKLKSVAPTVVATDTAGAAAGGTAAVKSSDAAPPQTYPFAIAFDGNYDSMLRMVEAIEFSARPMRVVGFQMTGTSAGLSGQIDVETYYQDKAKLPLGTETIK